MRKKRASVAATAAAESQSQAEERKETDTDLSVSSLLGGSPSPTKKDESLLIDSNKRIEYEHNPTDGDDASSGDFQINDDDEGAAGLKHHGVGARANNAEDSSDCDVDEHAEINDF